MPKSKKRQKRLVKEIEFKICKGKSLVVSMGFPSIGLDRIIIENNQGVVEVKAQGRSRFEFSDKKIGPHACDFWLSNPPKNILLEDYIISQFWGQFTWGDLAKFQSSRVFKKSINVAIKELIAEFESKAVGRLNGIVEQFRNPRYKVLKNGQIQNSVIPGKYGGYRPRKIFGRLDCKAGMCMKKENRVFFLTWQDAIDAGYRPCKNCNPTSDDAYPNR